MKTRLLLFLIIILGTGFLSMGQRRIELTPTAGYQFGGHINYNEGSFRVLDAGVYGGSLGVEIRPNLLAQFTYTYMGTTGEFTSHSNAYPNQNINMAMQYFLLGIEPEFGNKIKGFGDFGMGVAWFDSQDPKVSSVVEFAVSLGGGAKIMFSKHVGIKMQGHLLLPMAFAGVGGYYGMGTGGSSSGVYVSSYAVMPQGELSGGLIFCLGNN
jgi:hypothetical protein